MHRPYPPVSLQPHRIHKQCGSTDQLTSRARKHVHLSSYRSPPRPLQHQTSKHRQKRAVDQAWVPLTVFKRALFFAFYSNVISGE